MERGDVARLLSIADADVESFEENERGLFVDVRDGGRRVVTKDGLFAMDDHPANAQLRRWPYATGGIISPPNTGGDSVPALLSEGGYLTDTPIPPELAESLNKGPETIAEVPEGIAEVVLSWVDGDPERALAAWDVEQARDKPRSTLLAALEKLVSA